MNDDFGYLRSAIETAQRGRPWTDEWLEPWSASLATLSALVFSLSGSFHLAILGLQAAAAAATGAGFYALLCSRLGHSGYAAALAALALTFPTVLWKHVEYTSLIVYLPCLLWAIWAAERRRWLLFLALWLIALASRQSAIAWLAIPSFAAASRWSVPELLRSSRLRSTIAAGGGALGFAILAFAMNQTQAQTMITAHLWARVQADSAAHHVIFGLGLWGVFTGLGGLLAGDPLETHTLGSSLLRRNFAVLLAAVGVFTLLEFVSPIFFEHQAFDGWSGSVYRNLLLALGLLGWSLFRFRVRWDFALAGAASLALVALRKEVWDYYYLDLGLFAVFGATRPPAVAPVGAGSPRWPARWATAVIATLGCFHAGFAWNQKCRVDRDYAACVVTEKALRAGKLAPVEIGHAPGGFVGWHLHRHFLAHEGKNDPDIGGFLRYQRPDATTLRFSPLRLWTGSRSLRPIDGPDASRLAGSEIFRVGWIFHERVSLLRSPASLHPAAALDFDVSSYRPESFPLSDREWRDYLHQRAFTSPAAAPKS